jgi:tartrate-resistant acid phosphatase type 5
MRNGKLTLIIVFVCLAATSVAVQQSSGPSAVRIAPVLARLPSDWRQASALLRISEAEQQRFLKLTDEGLRQSLGRLLIRRRDADGFVKTQIVRDPSPAVRSTLLQAISNDARWLAMPDTPALIESVIERDPEASVALTALDTMRRLRMRHLNTMLAGRAEAAKERGADPKTLDRFAEEQERWIALERGTMLPAFMRTPPPLFTVKPADTAVRVLAFGDFGNGSPEQKALAGTIAAYHRDSPFDLAVTLGDNFYSVGMLSPSDPRWQTWFEELYGSLGITFYPALGNHDWGHPDSPASELLYSGQTPTWKMPATYYTFTAGAVQFFALDTQTIVASSKQREWLDRELKRSVAPWKVVYGHHPIFSGGNYQDRPDLIESVLPLLQSRADVYICGHDHNLQALRPEGGVHFYVAGGGGAGLYDLREYERSIFASRSNGFAVIDGYQSRLRISLVDGTGKTIYEKTLQRAATSTESGR